MDKNNRIENILAVILLNTIKGAKTADKVAQLNLAGFTNIEIADLLETSPQVIRQALYMRRRGQKRK